MRVTNKTSPSKPDVIVGTPLCRRTSFVLDKFLSNQREIQQAYPDCRLVLATDEPDFVAELKQQIKHHRLKGDVIAYKTVKPDYARSRIWSVTSGRNALRRYTLSRGAEYFLSFDADMVYDPSVISIMKSKIKGFDVVKSAHLLRPRGILGFGAGCLMINRETLDKITFICYEFKNGDELDDSESIDLELFRCHARVNNGIFVSFKHYLNRQEYFADEPQPLGWFRTVTNRLLARYMLLRMSTLAKHNIARRLQVWLYKGGKVLAEGE
jgi:hypothetical protein